MPKPSEFAQLFTFQLNAKFADYDFTVESGSKFDRIVQKSIKYGGGSVHCFILKATGEVFKAAGYKQPAPGVRYSDVFLAAEASDVHGSYLYK